MKLAVRRDQLGTLLYWKGREEPDDELVGVRGKRDAIWRIVEQACEPTPDFIGSLERLVPHIVDQLGGIQPGLLLRFERDVRPGLMGMTGQQDSLVTRNRE